MDSIYNSEFSTEGCNYGGVKISNNEIVMESTVSSKPILNIKVDNIALCVVPATNRDEIEIQFQDNEKNDRHDDGLVQMTLHFPSGEDEDGTQAEQFQKSIMSTGVIRSVTGNIIAEFSKEQGNFVTPRGKYTIQMTATYMHMQGAQYAYKIKYDDINALFLLPKMDGGRMAFVISLEKPIRQGNQKYQNLVLETHKLEHTLTVNLTEEEIATRYEGQLSPSMTMPMSSLIAKVFKVLSQKKVFIPKQFLSARDAHCIRCSIKANDGLLYPLAKSFIFINKPCVIIKFEDIDYAEFKRYEPAANSATRNFDLVIYVKEAAAATGVDSSKEYAFMSIDRSEYSSLFDYLNSKEIKIKNPQEVGPAFSKTVGLDLGGEEGGSGGDESEDDGDYEGGGDSSHSGDSDDSGGESGGEDGEGEQSVRREESKVAKDTKKRKAPAESREDKLVRAKKAVAAVEEKGGKKKRAKKDKNAPKGVSSSYILFSKEERLRVLAENPSIAMTEASKLIGARWKALEADEKRPFEELAKVDKERYAREMVQYKTGQPVGSSNDVEGEEISGAEDEEDVAGEVDEE